MPTLLTLLPFFGISLVLGFTPGPDNLFVLLQSATRGARSGMVIVLGLCTGLVVAYTGCRGRTWRVSGGVQRGVHSAQERRGRVSRLSGMAGVARSGQQDAGEGPGCRRGTSV